MNFSNDEKHCRYVVLLERHKVTLAGVALQALTI